MEIYVVDSNFFIQAHRITYPLDIAISFWNKVHQLAEPNRIVVTQEISEPNKKNKIKIPDCCNAFGVKYKNTIEMFRRLGETF